MSSRPLTPSVLIRASPVVLAPSPRSSSPMIEKQRESDFIFERDMEFPAGNNHTLTQTESIDLSVPTNLIECFSNNLEEPSESSLELEIQPKKIKFPTSSSPNSPSETQENDKPQRVKELSSPSSTRRLSFVSYSDLINEERLSELLGKSRQEGQEGDEEGCMEFMMASSLEN